MENTQKTTMLSNIRKAEAEAEATLTAAEAEAQTMLTKARQDGEDVLIQRKQELEQSTQKDIEKITASLKQTHIKEIKKARMQADAYKTRVKKNVSRAVDYLLTEFTRLVKVK